MIGDWFGPARYSLVMNVINDTEKLYDTLLSMDIQLLLVNKRRPLCGKEIQFGNSFSERFELISKDSNGALYGLRNLKEVQRLKAGSFN